MNPLKWRECAAVALMHTEIAAQKLRSNSRKESKSLEEQQRDLAKAVECIEAAHAAAMDMYNEFANLSRYRKTVRGVRLTSIKDTMRQPMSATVAELIRK